MLWIQLSDGAIIDELCVDRKKCMRGKEALLMADGISLGKLTSWTTGEFYELSDLYTVISRENFCKLFDNHEEITICDVFEAMDSVVQASTVNGEENMQNVIDEQKKLAELNPNCVVHVRRLTGINRKVVYAIYAKITGAKMSALEQRPARNKKRKFRIGVNKQDKHLYL